jgi:hypothetical protein
MLHITNGESVIHSFAAARLEGAYLSWLDVLYEGPVPDLPHEALSDVRARAIAALGWGDDAAVRSAFAARDAVLAALRDHHHDHDEIVLWFEHDLFDQLQLIQALAWFAEQGFGGTPLSLVYIASHEQIPALLRERRPVTAGQLSLGRAAWKAFCAPEPQAIVELLSPNLSRDLLPLPFLSGALRRLLEEYPSTQNGLSRTEQQLLEAIASGKRERADIFLSSQQREESVFLGDSSAWLRLDRKTEGPAPALLKTAPDQYSLTPFGNRLLAGEADWIRGRGGIDLWLGGVHLTGSDAPWRWDRERRVLSGPTPT